MCRICEIEKDDNTTLQEKRFIYKPAMRISFGNQNIEIKGIKHQIRADLSLYHFDYDPEPDKWELGVIVDVEGEEPFTDTIGVKIKYCPFCGRNLMEVSK